MNKLVSDESARLLMLRSILTSHATQEDRVAVGVAELDDAAVIKVSDTTSLVIASDFIRGSQFYLFELGYMNYFDVGYYLVVANLSDIAAMGATPSGLLTVVRYSQDMSDEDFRAVFEGIETAAQLYGVPVVGGDIGGYRADVFAATAFGFIHPEKVLLRSGAEPGDLLCITGTIGLPATALVYFKEVKQLGFSLPSDDEARLLKSWQRPAARLDHGSILSSQCFASACQDVSDGLRATVEQLGKRSGVGFRLYQEQLPLDSTTLALAEFLRVDPVHIAASASVDFELAFTLPPEKLEPCRHAFAEQGLKFFVIGEATHGIENVLISKNDELGPLPGVPWNHQVGDLARQILASGSPTPGISRDR